MGVSSSKEAILKKIRKALIESTPIPFPQSEGTQSVFQPPSVDLDIQFAGEFSKLQGKFSFCLSTLDLATQVAALCKEKNWTHIYCSEPEMAALLASSDLQNLFTGSLEHCDAAITSCEALVARTGSVVLSPANGGRTTSVYAPVHICIAFSDQLVYDIKDALQHMKEKYPALPSFISFATGPSRTADIEKTLVTGVHGPKETYVFLLDR